MKNIGTGAMALIALGAVLATLLALHFTGVFSLLKKPANKPAASIPAEDAAVTSDTASKGDTALRQMRRVA